MSLNLSPAHGAVVLAVVASWATHLGLGVKVMKARKEFGVSYPDLYATPENCKNEEHRKKFNCVQRGHQNALENQAAFLGLLITSGARFPITSAVAGGLYLLGRILYMQGYSSGDPKSRSLGFFPQYAGLLTLVGSAVRFGFELLMSAR